MGKLLFVYAISGLFLIICEAIFIRRRYSWWKTAAFLGLCYGWIVLLVFLRYWLEERGIKLRSLIILEFLGGVCTVLAISEYRDSRAVFTAFLSGSYTMTGDTVAKAMLKAGASLGLTIVVQLAVHMVLLYLLVRLLYKPYLNLQREYREEWRGFCIMLLMFYCGMYLLYACLKGPEVTGLHFAAPMFYLLTVYLIIVLEFRMLDKLSEREMEDSERRVMAAGMEALKHEVENIHRAERWIAEYNHNSRHFVRMLRGMLAEKDYASVGEALNQLSSMPPELHVSRYCDNLPIGGVLAYYAGKAKEQGIFMSVKLENIPESLGDNEWELATVLGNLLDNAMQASKEAEEEQRYIHVSGQKLGERLLFEIRNTYAGEVLLDRTGHLPLVGNAAGRGLDMKSVGEMIKRWNGVLDCGLEEEWFYVRLLV